MINKATLLGRPTADPDISYTQANEPVCVARFTLAVTRKYKKDEADFIRCVCFGKLAEIIQKYVKKGDQICVAGRIHTGSYTDREGTKRYTTDVVVEDMQMCGTKGEKNQEAQAAAPAPAPEPQYEQQSFLPETPKEVSDGFMSMPPGFDDELPFI